VSTPPTLSDEDRSELERLEESLWRAPTRFDRAYMEGVLAPDFFEFGRSGRVYDRDEMLAVGGATIPARLPLRDFAARPISDGVVLVTYVSAVGEAEPEYANRSSLWTRTGRGWRLRFHQGTPRGV
jgi:hypothetical protein